ncbi:hypothetical protein R3X27_05750 [Tropicimonas sp. TH_r6]|uniref:hypothetical protein n=1 Tax=Tropicimonas sp. TH_r6 TaxID=3082085 RepID=UPI002954658E|nr:hypothetical protein [Tropicimonas sp. TH_r6]MDV7142178.1 hypothetical protein [Tropicimonas sp. TH_r6]
MSRVHNFLSETRRDISAGRLEAVLARYARPLVLVHDGFTETLEDEEALRGHALRVAELSDDTHEPIWRQEIANIQVLDPTLLAVTAEVYRVDIGAHPLPKVRQTLVLRRLGETFQIAAILNPIRHDTLNSPAPEEGGGQ